jgi:outer membrane protein assembly factor BamB
VAPDAKTVSTFSADENLVWKAKLPGPGNSTPIVSGGKTIVTCGIGGKDAVVTYDSKGKELWRAVFGKEVPGKGQRVGTGSNSTPVTDGKGIFAYFKSGRIAALTMAGEKVWESSLHEKYGEDNLWWDQGTSPVLAGGHVVVTVMQTEGNSYLVALDKQTGQEVWKTERKFDVAAESGDSYTTPLVMTIDGVETIVNWGADHLTGHDASSGELLWTCGGFNPGREKFWRVIASAAATEGIVAVPYARGKQMAGVKVGGKGDITAGAFLWKRDGLGSDAATPAAHNGKFYVLIDSDKNRGTVVCLDAVTGKSIWEEELPKGVQIYYASPLVAGDKLYCAREDGVVFCGTITATGLTNLTENRLEETVIASPVAIGDRLYIRGRDHLYCFGK